MANTALLHLVRQADEMLRRAHLPPSASDIRDLLQHAPERRAAIECRNCGNPKVVGGEPCRFCQVVTEGPRRRPAWQCPRCGRAVAGVERERDVQAGAVVIVVRCHGAHREARVSDVELEDLIERDAMRGLVARRVAEAIDRFAEDDAS